MKLNKGGFWVWPASLGAGFSLAYSTACHWFGFLYASKINRLEMLLGFGAVFSILSWQLVRQISGSFFEKISWGRFYLCIGAAVVVAGAAALFVLPLSQNSLIPLQMQPGGPLPTIMRLLWTGLRLADFLSLTTLLLVGEVILITVINHWGSIIRFIHRVTNVFPTLGIVLFLCLLANLNISATDKVGMLHHLKSLPSNDLLSLAWNQTYMKEARGYTILFEHYKGWTLIAPVDLLNKMGINSPDKLKRWGRIGNVIGADYPTDLSKQEMKNLLSLKNVKVQNGSGLQYIAILDVDLAQKICLRTYANNIFIVPVSFSPICENIQ